MYKQKHNPTIVLIVKILAALLFLFLLYKTIVRKHDFEELVEAFLLNAKVERIHLIFVVFVLMIANWYLESLKWQNLLRPIQVYSVFEAARGVLIGLTASIFTPNRMGEYAGRILVLSSGQRWSAAVALSIGSALQMLFIFLLGTPALWYLHVRYLILPDSGKLLTVVVALLCTLLFVIIIFRKRISAWVQTQLEKRVPPLYQVLSFASRYRVKDLLMIILLTAARIGIYVGQYVLMLYILGVDLCWQEYLAGVLAVYMIQTGLPLPSYFSFLARGEIALLIWSNFEINELTVLVASYGIWVINVAVPALCGMVLLLRLKSYK